MKSAILQFLLAGTLGLGLSVTTMHAQTNQADRKVDAKTVNVTGCLQKGAAANEYAITGEDGKTYGLHSTSVKLEDHLNHKVTVTGKTATKESTAKADKAGAMPEASNLNVSSLKMVSTSCQ